MDDRVKEIRERVRRVNSAAIEGTIDRVIAGIADPVERILFAFACRYAGGVTSGDFERAADAMETALSALRASDTGRSEAEAMREAVENALTEWTRPSAIRLMIGETTTAQEGRTANAVAAAVASKVRTALSQPAKGEGAPHPPARGVRP